MPQKSFRTWITKNVRNTAHDLMSAVARRARFLNAFLERSIDSEIELDKIISRLEKETTRSSLKENKPYSCTMTKSLEMRQMLNHSRRVLHILHLKASFRRY